MLSDKLDNLMVALKISSVDIAGAAGFDRKKDRPPKSSVTYRLCRTESLFWAET